MSCHYTRVMAEEDSNNIITWHGRDLVKTTQHGEDPDRTSQPEDDVLVPAV